ncbi:hypothetical protein G3578_06070 [Brevibacillus sp. SYP-B805]|uniref:hypothetical protein n=1 Tax=Brevibacillus sp. SYP-B805 TaxID=1578199 RepID=UPI0013F710BD|nr:hypothetical protein [Brevibacillus sp. SYP-B805]NGQ94749.1 hypothetical protein [Brevibacillus sp. SYP-B805]
MIRRAPLLLVVLLLLLHAQTAGAEGTWQGTLTKNIQQWIQTISRQDPQFAAWKRADTEIRALGVNQHQWLVTVREDGRQVGYLVVGEVDTAASGSGPVFALLEYGAGAYILFDEAIAPDDGTAVPVYDGFASFWQVTDKEQTRYVDAKTGERYPEGFLPDPPTMGSVEPDGLVTAEKKLTAARVLTAQETNPFDRIDWVMKAADKTRDSSRDDAWQTLTQPSAHQPAILTVSLFHDQVTAPFTIGSVHLWSDEAAYVGVWDEGLRFLPISYVRQVGTLIK